MAKSICSSVPDHRCQDSRWVALELRPLMQKNDDEMTYTITLRALSAWLQKMRWDDKIALFKEYAGNNDSATFDESDVLEQLDWNSSNPKEIGYFRTFHQTRRETLRRNENQTEVETQKRREDALAGEAPRTDSRGA